MLEPSFTKISFLVLLDMRQARGSCASFVFGFVTFMSIGGFPSFVEDMKVNFTYSPISAS